MSAFVRYSLGAKGELESMQDPVADTTTTERFAPDGLLPTQSEGHLSRAGKTWLISGLLLLIIGFIVGRTVLVGGKKDSKDLTELIEGTFDALETTKIAYTLKEYQAQTPTLPKHPLTSSKKGSALPLNTNSSETRLEEDAIRKWRKLTREHPNYASPWRKLGLTLSLFHRAGAMDAFRHIATLPDDKPTAPVESETKSRRRAQSAADQQELLPHAQEFALWKMIYGSEPVDGKRTAELRAQIEKLKLGWFEHVALAQLYTRTGQAELATQSMENAISSAEQISILSGGEVFFALIGLMILSLYCVIPMADWMQRRSLARSLREQQGTALPSTTLPTSASFPVIPPLPVAYSSAGAVYPGEVRSGTAPQVPPLPAATNPSVSAQKPSTRFSYWSRGIAFIIYMVVFLVIGLPFRYLTTATAHWTPEALTRLSAILQIVLYLPIVFITLMALRRLVAAETPGGKRPTWRETLEGIGLFSRRPLQDIGAGALAYTMAFPVFLAVTLLSAWVFQRFHTPINPVEVEMMVSQSRLDQLLMLIQAAVAAPIVEEMMFRGLLFPALRERWGTVMGILLSSACFALVHPNLPSGFLPLWTLGAAFAITFQRRGSLLPNIVMHGLHNGFVTLTLFALFAK